MRSGGKRCSHQVTGALALGWLLVGCSNDPNALFARVHADSGARTVDAAVDAGDARSAPAEPADILSLYADLGAGDACPRCLRKNCSESERTCLQDPECTANARCAASCRDPSCMLRCQQTLTQQLSLATGPESPTTCRARACVKECAVGRVFDCVGQYEWDRPPSVKVTPTVTVLSFGAMKPVPSDVHVRLCSAALAGCDGVDAFTLEPSSTHSSAAFDVVGQHTLEPLVLSNHSYFEVTAPGYDAHLAYFMFDRSSRAPEMFLSVAPPQIYAVGFDNFRVKDDPAYGFLELYPVDCMTDPAPGIHFELSSMTSDSHVIPWYGYPPDPDLDRTEPGGGMAGFALVDEGLVTVRAKLADSDEVVARISLVSRAGSRTIVLGLTPRSASEPR